MHNLSGRRNSLRGGASKSLTSRVWGSTMSGALIAIKHCLLLEGLQPWTPHAVPTVHLSSMRAAHPKALRPDFAIVEVVGRTQGRAVGPGGRSSTEQSLDIPSNARHSQSSAMDEQHCWLGAVRELLSGVWALNCQASSGFAIQYTRSEAYLV